MLQHFACNVTWVVGLVEATYSMSPGVMAISAQVVAGRSTACGALVAAALDGEQAAGIAANAASMEMAHVEVVDTFVASAKHSAAVRKQTGQDTTARAGTGGSHQALLICRIH